jgi:uroporphyrinogen decarboxylase
LLQPLARFPLDAAILFSDILTIPTQWPGVVLADGEGPRFERRCARMGDPRACPTSIQTSIFDTCSTPWQSPSRHGEVPLIGFAKSAVACYMIEGRGSTEFGETKSMLYRRPDLLHRILEVNAQAVTAYLNAQIEAGARRRSCCSTLGAVRFRILPTASFRCGIWNKSSAGSLEITMVRSFLASYSPRAEACG